MPECFKHSSECLIVRPGSQFQVTNQRFTSGEVVSLTGITPRQLQWWDERGIVMPVHEGHRRFYTPDDLAEVAVICELRNRGFSLQRVRKVMRFVQKEFGKRLVETVATGSDYHLLTDGTHIYVETSAKQIIDILKNSRQPMLTVCISDMVRQVMPELRSDTTAAKKSASSPKKMSGNESGRLRRKELSSTVVAWSPARGATRAGVVSSAAFRRGRTL